jgi:hypothetical protein
MATDGKNICRYYSRPSSTKKLALGDAKVSGPNVDIVA